MNDSILNSIKKLLGITKEYIHFDSDIILHINSTMSILNQLGVGPLEGFSITNEDDKWSDLIGDETNLDMVKSYVHLRVKLLFDPPVSSAVMESMNRMLSELEWRIIVKTEKPQEEEKIQNGE